ncbi:MAG: tyrosine-type recombinase/integrase, partial [Bullifex sp.]|nr:tyrosine-type recombinase/integrase [Bullifex sp.]
IVISQDGEYMSSLTLRLSFYNVLFALGISEEVRCERRLTFHSLRHYFSTYTCQENISQEDRMVVLGHRSEKVNDRYTHISDARLERVAEVMEKLYRIK